MKTYKHKTNGTIATYKDGIFKQGNICVEIGCEPSSEFWEEAIFITEDGVPIFTNDTYFVPQRAGSKYKAVLEFPAEKRDRKDLSRTFSTKEKAFDFIKEHNKHLVELAKYYQTPILTTFDGVELFGNEKCYIVSKEYLTVQHSVVDNIGVIYLPNFNFYFAKKENAEKYIFDNEKRYSLNDIKETVKKLGCFGTTLIEYLEDEKTKKV
jgi:hypothetical protein